MDEQALRSLDGHALCLRAWELGLAPDGTKHVHGELVEADWLIVPPTNYEWVPHQRIDQAQAAFNSLRARGWSTSVVWFADHRQYGEAWAACSSRAYSARWPLDVPSEAHALLLVSVLVAEHLHGIPANTEG